MIWGDDIGWSNLSDYHRGMPGAEIGLQAEDPTIAELLNPLGYTSGQFGKNHLGDKDKFLPINHGFDEFLGNLYHLNAEEEPETYFYPKDPAFRKRLAPHHRDLHYGQRLPDQHLPGWRHGTLPG